MSRLLVATKRDVHQPALPSPTLRPPLASPFATFGRTLRKAFASERRSDEPSVVLAAASSTGEAETASLAAVTAPAEVDELVRRSRNGDRMAFAALYRLHREIVGRLVFRMIGRASDVEDVIQEVFLQVHKSLGDFRGQSKFSTWLHRITVNVVLMNRRAQRSRPVFADEPVEGEREADIGLLPDEETARKRRISAFRRLLDKLSEKKRTVYVLHDIEGMLPAEIASIVEAPVLTVRTRLFYARRELAAMMREEPALSQLVDELAKEMREGEARDQGQHVSSEEGEGA